MAAFSLRRVHGITLRLQKDVHTQSDSQGAVTAVFIHCDHSRAQKVSDVWRQATAAGPACEVQQSRHRGNRRYVSDQNVQSFAEQFAPPVRRVQQSTGFFTPITTFLAFSGIFSLIGLHRLAHPTGTMGMLLFLYLVVSLLGLVLQERRFLKSPYTVHQEKALFALETRAWHEAIRRWDRTYYCSCCGQVYDLETGETMPVCKMQELLDVPTL